MKTWKHLDIENRKTISSCISHNYKLINIIDAFPMIPKIILDDKMAFKVRNGCVLDNFFDDEMAFLLDKDNNLLALYKKENDKCRAFRVF